MKKLREFVASPAVTMACLVLAIGLLLFSTIGGARAALTYYSENYVSNVQMQQIAVSLVENGQVVATDAATRDSGALLGQLYLAGSPTPEPADAPFKLGANYAEQLAVQNPASSGEALNITQYVRVTIHKYWMVPAEERAGWTKSQTLDPSLIGLRLLTQESDGSGWLLDADASTPERTVLYYSRPLAPGQTTPLFADILNISADAALTVEQTTEGGVTTTTYVYDNASFQLDVQVDAVQEHNAADAIYSAWGRRVTIAANGDLSLD